MSLICSRVRTSGNGICDGNEGASDAPVDVAGASGDVEGFGDGGATRRGSLGFACSGA